MQVDLPLSLWAHLNGCFWPVSARRYPRLRGAGGQLSIKTLDGASVLNPACDMISVTEV
jgi:hypothetical protein